MCANVYMRRVAWHLSMDLTNPMPLNMFLIQQVTGKKNIAGMRNSIFVLLARAMLLARGLPMRIALATGSRQAAISAWVTGGAG